MFSFSYNVLMTMSVVTKTMCGQDCVGFACLIQECSVEGSNLVIAPNTVKKNLQLSTKSTMIDLGAILSRMKERSVKQDK